METRQRLVEATVALHAEQPIAETTMRQIAERAGVGIGTVYNHFPTYDDAVTACGEHSFAKACPPSAAIFDGLDSQAERIETLVRELYAFYGRIPGMAAARADRGKIAALDRALSAWEDMLHGMVLLASGADVAPDRLCMAETLLDYGTYERLSRCMPTGTNSADQVVALLKLWFSHPETQS